MGASSMRAAPGMRADWITFIFMQIQMASESYAWTQWCGNCDEYQLNKNNSLCARVFFLFSCDFVVFMRASARDKSNIYIFLLFLLQKMLRPNHPTSFIKTSNLLDEKKDHTIVMCLELSE